MVFCDTQYWSSISDVVSLALVVIRVPSHRDLPALVCVALGFTCIGVRSASVSAVPLAGAGSVTPRPATGAGAVGSAELEDSAAAAGASFLPSNDIKFPTKCFFYATRAFQLGLAKVCGSGGELEM